MTREPGGTTLGERVRSLVLDSGQERLHAETEALLFTASRAQLVADVIQPALRSGRVVVSDRFSDSTLAYQWGGRGLDRIALEGMQKLALQGVRPDVTILFDISPEVALERRRREAEHVNRLDSESLAFYERVRDAYLILASENRVLWKIVDASQTIERVWEQTVVALNDSGLNGLGFVTLE
jgi:dTMP kinase